MVLVLSCYGSQNSFSEFKFENHWGRWLHLIFSLWSFYAQHVSILTYLCQMEAFILICILLFLWVHSVFRPSVRQSACQQHFLRCLVQTFHSFIFHSFIFKLWIMIIHTLQMCTSFFVTLHEYFHIFGVWFV